jgi:2,3-diaminopropionate biosynthesis protein SbnB
MFDFEVVTGQAVEQILHASPKQVISAIEDAYLRHDGGQTINPDSYFLRFPDKPDCRIIALPAFIDLGDTPVTGIKWISSFPTNVASGIPRASAVLLLNDYATGYPIALLEAATISAVRTAASAAVAAHAFARHIPPSGEVAILGAGVIARTILRYLALTEYPIQRLQVFDLDPDSMNNLIRYAEEDLGIAAVRAPTAADAATAQTVITATTAGRPYLSEPLRAGQVALNISLRDFGPNVILRAANYFDDVEHCMKADTSPHLAEQVSGARDFVSGTLADVLQQRNLPSGDRAVVFSPFGLGVLDLAIGHLVLVAAREQQLTHRIADFFGSTRRW